MCFASRVDSIETCCTVAFGLRDTTRSGLRAHPPAARSIIAPWSVRDAPARGPRAKKIASKARYSLSCPGGKSSFAPPSVIPDPFAYFIPSSLAHPRKRRTRRIAHFSFFICPSHPVILPRFSVLWPFFLCSQRDIALAGLAARAGRPRDPQEQDDPVPAGIDASRMRHSDPPRHGSLGSTHPPHPRCCSHGRGRGESVGKGRGGTWSTCSRGEAGLRFPPPNFASVPGCVLLFTREFYVIRGTFLQMLGLRACLTSRGVSSSSVHVCGRVNHLALFFADPSRGPSRRSKEPRPDPAPDPALPGEARREKNAPALPGSACTPLAGIFSSDERPYNKAKTEPHALVECIAQGQIPPRK